jgi:hypothetical protein
MLAQSGATVARVERAIKMAGLHETGALLLQNAGSRLKCHRCVTAIYIAGCRQHAMEIDSVPCVPLFMQCLLQESNGALSAKFLISI